MTTFVNLYIENLKDNIGESGFIQGIYSRTVNSDKPNGNYDWFNFPDESGIVIEDLQSAGLPILVLAMV